MPENFSPNNLETEIKELERKIEEKRRLLESESSVVEEKELVRESVSDLIKENLGGTNEIAPSFSPSSSSPVSASPSAAQAPSSYLDTLDQETSESLSALLEELPKKGLKKTLDEAAKSDAYTLDAFHDLLVDRFYEELKARGIVK